MLVTISKGVGHDGHGRPVQVINVDLLETLPELRGKDWATAVAQSVVVATDTSCHKEAAALLTALTEAGYAWCEYCGTATAPGFCSRCF